jgi:hypothetical protein
MLVPVVRLTISTELFFRSSSSHAHISKSAILVFVVITVPFRRAEHDVIPYHRNAQAHIWNPAWRLFKGDNVYPDVVDSHHGQQQTGGRCCHKKMRTVTRVTGSPFVRLAPLSLAYDNIKQASFLPSHRNVTVECSCDSCTL